VSTQTALAIIQDAAREMSLAAPSSAASSSDLTAQQLFAHYNALGRMLVSRRGWVQLFKEYPFNTAVGTVSYALPADFKRPVTQTEWDRVAQSMLRGPASKQEWQFIRSAGVSSGLSWSPQFKLLVDTAGNKVLTLASAPVDIRALSFWYISKNWVFDASSQGKDKATADDDTAVFPDPLMVAGVKLRFFQAKGFDTTSLAADFQTALDDATEGDDSAPVLSLDHRARLGNIINVNNLPESGYGL
jgi:hypothetical protein